MLSLTNEDIAVLIKIIDLGSNRGIFNGPDLSRVGAVRDRLVQIINAASTESGDA